MNHVYAKQGINSIVTGSDTGSGITYSTLPSSGSATGWEGRDGVGGGEGRDGVGGRGGEGRDIDGVGGREGRDGGFDMKFV